LLRARAHHRAPARASDTVDGGLHDDLEHALAVEAARERLADAADRFLESSALPSELLQAGLELSGHAVELAPERGELVVAVGRDLDAEVAPSEPLRGDEQALDLGLEGSG